jgi:hypothetical protein
MSDVRDEDIETLFEDAKNVLHEQSMCAQSRGWRCIEELERRLGFGLAPPDRAWIELSDEHQTEILHEVSTERLFATLQQIAMMRDDVDVSYSLLD